MSVVQARGAAEANRSPGMDPPVGRVVKDSYALHVHGRTGPLAPLSVVPAADPPSSATGRYGRLADELAPMVEVWERLLAVHLPDRNGRCRTCTQGGTGLPGTHWPCALHGIASLARRRHGDASEP